MNKKIFFCVLLFVIVTTGCATTDDPREGGLIGYMQHKDDYERRIEERQNKLGELQEEGEREKQKTSALEDERARLQADLDRQRKMLDSLDAELEELSETIKLYQAETDAKQQEKEKIELEIETLKNKIAEVRRDTKLSIQEREQKIEDLHSEIDGLLEIMGSL